MCKQYCSWCKCCMFLLVASRYAMVEDLPLRDDGTDTNDLTENITSLFMLREGSANQVIRIMWKQLMDNLGHNVILLAGQLYSTGNITLNEENIIMAKNDPRDRTAELLLTVERKGWACLVEFVKGLMMDELKPIHHLAKNMMRTMGTCRKLFIRKKNFKCSTSPYRGYQINQFPFSIILLMAVGPPWLVYKHMSLFTWQVFSDMMIIWVYRTSDT